MLFVIILSYCCHIFVSYLFRIPYYENKNLEIMLEGVRPVEK